MICSNTHACPSPEVFRSGHGFTLPEVLFSLLLFSLVLLMLYSGLYHAGNNWRMSEIQLRKNDDKRFILSFIRTRIEQAWPIIQVNSGETRILFQGSNDGLQFVSTLPSHEADDGLYFLKFELQQDELVFKYLPLSRHKDMFVEDIFADAEPINLVKHVEMIDLDYFGRHAPDVEPAWGDVWNNRHWLPQLLRVRFRTNNHHPWPPLVIVLRSQAEWRPPQLALYMEEDAYL